MSAKQQSVASESPETVDENHPQTGGESRLVLRDTAIAGLALLVLVLALALYFALSRDDDAPDRPREVSAAGWIKQEAIATPPSASAPEGDEISLAGPAEPEPDEKYAPEPEAVLSEEGAGDGDSVRQGTVQSGVPVIKSLQKLGLTLQQAHGVITALDGIFDFRRARPGQSFELSLDGAGEPARFVYHASLTEVYEVRRQGDAYKGSKRHIATQKTEKGFGGTISSSLYKTLDELGAHPGLAGAMVGVLANDLNFYKEQRPGDTFRVLVEEESLNGEFLGYGPVIALEYNGIKTGKTRFFYFTPPDSPRSAYYYNGKGISQPRSVLSIPLHYTRLSSRFGMRFHPVLKQRKLHNGVDFSAPTGTPVWACRAGTITIAGKLGANGNLVAIRHDEDLESFYAHLVRFARGIKTGVTVRERQVIGYVGNTGRSTGPHLHWGLKKGGRFIDPLKYKVQPGRPIEAKYRKKLTNHIRVTSAKLDRIPIRPPTEPLAEVKESEDDALGVEDW